MNLSLQPKKFINSQHTGKYVKINVPYGRKNAEIELNLHYMDEGNGEPLILVHTIGQSLYTWRNLIPQISSQYRVIAIDLMGHGYSDKPISALYSIEEHAHIIRLFMDAIGIESAHFLGFSMGCAYVTELARTNPDRVGKMLLLSPGGITSQMPLFIRMLDSVLFGGIASMLLSQKRVEEALQQCYLDLTLVSPEIVKGYFSPLEDVETRRAVRFSAVNYDEEASFKDLRNVVNQTLILLGSDDRWHSTEYAELFQAALPNAYFSVVRNAGHLLHEEKPEKIASAIKQFVPVPIIE